MKILSTVCVEAAPKGWNWHDDVSGEKEFEGEYRLYRIPSVVVTDGGTVVCAYECRRGVGDWSEIDLGVSRSTDGGKTFSPRKIIVSGEDKDTVNNPVLIADGEKIHLIYCENYKRMFYRQSTDGGENFSPATEITDVFRNIPRKWSCIASGPCHGIKCMSGRLIFPVWCAANPDDEFAHHPSFTLCAFSDDGGKTWQAGDPIEENGVIDPNESTVAELDDGGIIINTRSEAAERCRSFAVSRDGGKTFSPYRIAPELADPVCCGSMISSDGVLYMTNCADRKSRRNLSFSTSRDGGKTWTTETLHSDDGGYSDLARDKKSGRIYVFYESESIRYLKIDVLG